MWWVILLDVVAVVGGLAALGLAAWRLVVRPGLRLGRTVGDLADRASAATESLGATTDALGTAGSGIVAGAGSASRRTVEARQATASARSGRRSPRGGAWASSLPGTGR